MSAKDYAKAAARELKRWPLARIVDRVRGGKHCRLIIEYRGVRRFVVYPSSPNDGRAGPRNHAQDIRRTLREIDECMK